MGRQRLRQRLLMVGLNAVAPVQATTVLTSESSAKC